MRSEQEINRAVELYSDTVKRICVLYLKNAYDTGDIFQEFFLKYALSSVRKPAAREGLDNKSNDKSVQRFFKKLYEKTICTN